MTRVARTDRLQQDVDCVGFLLLPPVGVFLLWNTALTGDCLSGTMALVLLPQEDK